MKIVIKDSKGQSTSELDASWLVKEELCSDSAVHQTVVAYLANQRSGTACTKTVGEVAGSNKKPWRQKGTGRARAGSLRSPLWRGGGVTFGPKPRDYSKKVNAKTRKSALVRALHARVNDGDVVSYDGVLADKPTTSGLWNQLVALGLTGTVLIITSEADKNVVLSARNIPGVEVTTADLLNTYETLRADHLVFVGDAFSVLQKRLA